MIRIEATSTFSTWFNALDDDTKGRIQDRLYRVQNGNFGDHKSISEGVSELRLHFGSGIRIYYTHNGTRLVLLLAGGDKGTQKRDIAKAMSIAKQGGD